MTIPWTRYSTVVVLLLLFLIPELRAQRPDRSGNSLRVQYALFELPGSSTDSAIVDLLYRIPGNQFIFLRDQSSGQFIARGDLFIELRNVDNETTIRNFATIEIARSQQVRDQDDIPDYQGHLRLSVPAGDYRAIIEAKDLETGRSFLDRSQRFSFGLPQDSVGILRNPLLGFRDSSTGTIIPFNRGGAVRFGSRGGILFSMRQTDRSDRLTITWRLEQTTKEGEYILAPQDSTLTIMPGMSISPMSSSGTLAYRLASAVDAAWTPTFLDIPLEVLEPGTYSVNVTGSSAGTSITQTFQFSVIWEDRPMSLGRFDIAVDALRYIASEEDIDDMVGFMADGGRERFREFWKRKDPEPSTAYNEVMAEYYRRVDESILRFSTRGELDGYRSDRGRIYILFGTPTSMDRIFRPESGPREIWEYRQLNKRFIFTDPSRTGDYTLSQTEEL